MKKRLLEKVFKLDNLIKQIIVAVAFLSLLPLVIYILWFTFVSFTILKAVCGCVVLVTLIHSMKSL